MSAATVFCYVIDDDVSVVSDLNGNVKNVACRHFIRINHGCALKSGGGVLGNALKRLAEKTAGTRTGTCEFGDPNANPMSNYFSDD